MKTFRPEDQNEEIKPQNDYRYKKVTFFFSVFVFYISSASYGYQSTWTSMLVLLTVASISA
jgi:hypothetical protein